MRATNTAVWCMGFTRISLLQQYLVAHCLLFHFHFSAPLDLFFNRPSILGSFHVAANQVAELAEEVDPVLSFFAYQPLKATAKPGDSE